MSTTRPFIQADATALPFADDTFDLTVTSPPYLDARTYGIKAQRGCAVWVEWMLKVVAELARVTNGLVILNCAGVTRKWRYNPGPEGLLWEWWKQGGECWRPCYWRRVGVPGSGGKQWYRSDVEYLLAFKSKPGKLAYANPLANGHPPKWAPGGEMSYRNAVGTRRNQWGKAGASGVRMADGSRDNRARPSHQIIDHVFGNPASTSGRDKNGKAKPIYMNGNHAGQRTHTKRSPDGTMCEQTYNVPVLANPGNVLNVIVGGGVMGHPIAHENEAPYPEGVPEFFIKAFVPVGGKVLDPFSGSGTTVAVARKLGRIGIGCDLRFSQCELGVRRLATPYAKKVKKVREQKPEPSLFPSPPCRETLPPANRPAELAAQPSPESREA